MTRAETDICKCGHQYAAHDARGNCLALTSMLGGMIDPRIGKICPCIEFVDRNPAFDFNFPLGDD